MAADAGVAAGDRIQGALDDLEAQKALITNCTHLWRSLADYFSSLERQLADRSQVLDARFESLDADAHRALQSLDQRQECITDRESAAAALILERQNAVLSEIEGAKKTAATVGDIKGTLSWYARRMDSAGLWRFVVSRRKDLAVLRREIAEAVASSVDPQRLVVDAAEDFLNHYQDEDNGADRSWAFGMLLRALFDSEGRKAPEVAESMKERAAAVAAAWKEKFSRKWEGKGEAEGGMGSSEEQIFLQMIVAFGLRSRFEEELLRKLVVENASRKDMAKIAAGLGFEEKMADIINDLVNSGKELEAVYFAHESGLTEQCSPVPLLKSYLKASRNKSSSTSKNKKSTSSAMEESSSSEISALKSLIRCVEICKLESQFTTSGLKKRLAQMEKAKAERKNSTIANKSLSKRPRAASSATPNFRYAKANRTPSVPYASYGRSPPSVSQISAAHHVYDYTAQGRFDGVPSAPSVSYGVAHSQKPPILSQQYFAHDDIGGQQGGAPYSASSFSYGGYGHNADASSQQFYPR